MADTEVTLRVDGSQAIRTLQQVERNVQALNDRFAGLRNVLAGLAIGSFVQNTLQMANSLVQVSNATGIALDQVKAFTDAIVANGGSADQASEKLMEFVGKLDEARQGSADVQRSLARVGVTLEDLATLSDQEVFKKTIQGLAQMEDASKRQITAIKLLGENFNKVDVRNVAQAMSAGADTTGLREAAAAQQALVRAVNDLKTALLAAIAPFTEFFSKLNVGIETLKNIIKVFIVLGSVILSLNVVSRVMTFLVRLIVQAGAAAETLQAWILALSVRIGNMGKIGAYVSDKLAAFAMWFSNVLLKAPAVAAALQVIGQTIALIGSLVTGATTAMILWWNSIKQSLGFGEEAQKIKDEIEDTAGSTKAVVDAQRGVRLELEKTVEAYKQQGTELWRSMGLQNELIGMNERDANRKQKLFDLESSYLQRVVAIRQQYAELQRAAAVGTEDEKNKFAAFAAVYEGFIAKITKEYEGQINELNHLINQEEILRARERDRQTILEAITKQMERQASLGDALRSANDQMVAAQFEAGLAGKNPFERQIAQIQEQARLAALEAGRAFAAGFEDDGDGLTAERAQELANGLDQIAQRYRDIAGAQIATLQNSRTFAMGWSEAFREYVDNATNAANIARDIFSSVTSAMESMLDNFVKTGKLNFKDFARSVIQDIMKIQLKASLLKVWEGIGGAGGVGGFFRSLLGFADGGRPPLDQPSIVGERGPELFMPRTAGTIIPNHALAGMGGTQQVVNNYNYNISAVDAKSVAQLFMENRRTLLGVTEQARKELPIRQRF